MVDAKIVFGSHDSFLQARLTVVVAVNRRIQSRVGQANLGFYTTN